MTDPADNPLALATFGELLAEIQSRCNSFVLVVDRPQKVPKPNVVGEIDHFFPGGVTTALGLLDYTRHMMLRGFDAQLGGER